MLTLAAGALTVLLSAQGLHVAEIAEAAFTSTDLVRGVILEIPLREKGVSIQRHEDVEELAGAPLLADSSGGPCCTWPAGAERTPHARPPSGAWPADLRAGRTGCCWSCRAFWSNPPRQFLG